ncbi:MAG: PQQ-binding-like beta-propeller repeat protein [Halobacteriota archaeon]
MQLSKLFSFIAVALLVAVVFAGVVAIPAAAQTDTMQFRYNAQHTGDYSPSSGGMLPNNNLKWKFQTVDPSGGGGILTTPAVANGIVYTGSTENNFYAIDAATGHERWHYWTLGQGDTSSPAVAYGMVYFGTTDSHVYALDAQTGDYKWSFETVRPARTPTVADGVVYIGCNGGYLYALDAYTGQLKWSFLAPSQIGSYNFIVTAPAVANGMVYVATGMDGAGVIYALDAKTGAEQWRFMDGISRSYGSSPAVVDGVLYFEGVSGATELWGSGWGSGVVYALDATTGSVNWRSDVGTGRISVQDVTSSPAVVNGVVYIGGRDGLYALDASTGNHKWKFDTNGDIIDSSPAFADGVLYFGVYRHDTPFVGFVYAVDANTGAEKWHYNPQAGVYASPVIADGTLYFGDGDYGYLYALGKTANAAPSVTAVTVPIDPQRVNDPVSVSAAFTDPNLADTHTATWTWGDGTTSAGTITESNGAGTVSGSHVYAEAGVYTVSVKVTDNHDASAEATAQSYVVVYNPDGGFVTGGGWITSPTGAYANDPALAGKATFGFVSKYQKGANTPTGNTEFQFKVANLNFKSTSYDWLVIAGAKAQFKGTGTINGAGSYKFMLSAVDGNLKGTGPDTFRMKIWDDNGVVYDNLAGAPDTAAPTTTLGGGSIVIHP